MREAAGEEEGGRGREGDEDEGGRGRMEDDEDEGQKEEYEGWRRGGEGGIEIGVVQMFFRPGRRGVGCRV